MRKNQWYILSIILVVISGYFLWWIWMTTRVTPSITSVTDDATAAVWIVNRIYSIGFMVCIALAVACGINGWLEGRAEKEKEQKETLELKELDSVMEAADAMGLEHLPRNIPELVFWGKREGKEKEVDKAVETWVKKFRKLVTKSE